MQVLIVNSHFSKGGASRAAIRLQSALESINIKCDYLSAYPENITIFKNVIFKLRASLDRLPAFIASHEKIMFSSGLPSNRLLVNKINKSSADIVHIHWFNSGGLSIEDLAKINKPLVFTLHDMWLFTGGCHYDDGCGRYLEGCGKCPLLKSNKIKDLSAKVFERKVNSIQSLSSFAVIGLSKWIANEASNSLLFKGHNIVNLPNPINCKDFYPSIQNEAREYFSLAQDKKLILFGAMSALDDKRKGYKKILEALEIYKNKSDIELVVFGSDKPNNELESDYTINYLGYIDNDVELRLLYNAADIMLVPSLQENLSNAIMESMACGTPVVAFDIGGNSDMIDHRSNGYLAKPYDPKDFAKGISWILNSIDSGGIGNKARLKIVENFSSNVVGKKYKAFYSDFIVKDVKEA